MPFIRDESYTREHIHAELGGETVSYLPQQGGRIVCGCFSPDSNPEAPCEILIGGMDEEGGEGPVQRKTRILSRQDGSIPVFLKKAAGSWQFDGHYRLKGVIDDRDYIERKQRRAGRTDVVLALQMEPVEVGHDTYLLTWNPRSWAWDDLEDMVNRIATGRPIEDHWSCGNTKKIRPSDRLFLMRQGETPRGIVAAGWASTAVYEGPHWDPEKWERGETSLRVDLRFDRILNPEVDEILPLDKLQSGLLASVNWNTPASGIQIRQGADELERLWAELVGFYESLRSDFESVAAVEGEVRIALTRHRARERWLRDKKIAQAKAANAGRLPCEVCGFDFFEVYGEIGRDYAQVHHLKPLGDRDKPSLTRLEDLAVVCANCHVMLHRGGEARSLVGLLVDRRP